MMQIKTHTLQQVSFFKFKKTMDFLVINLCTRVTIVTLF